VVELWASDTSAFFGERVAVFGNAFDQFETSLRVEHATARRYFTLRVYDPAKRLRLDALRLYGEHADGSAGGAFPACVRSLRTSFTPGFFPVETVLEAASPPPPPRPPPFGRMVFRGGRRLNQKNELHVLWKTALRHLQAPPASLEEAHALLSAALPEGSQLDQLDQELPSNVKNVKYNVNVSWVDLLEEHHDELDDSGIFNLYPLRSPPGAHGKSPAASLAVALALADGPSDQNVIRAQNLLVNQSCAHLGGCEYDDLLMHTNPLLDQAFQPSHPYDSRQRDDGAWIAWLLSASIGPVVHLVSTRALLCASDEACGAHCAVCTMGDQRMAIVDVVRAVESALATGGLEQAHADVVACVRSSACVQSVAEGAAAALGSVAFPCDVENITEANDRLWAFAADDAARNESFDVRAPRRAAAARRHSTIGSGPPADWVRAHVVRLSGRRLGGAEKVIVYDSKQLLLHAASSAAATLLRTTKNASAALRLEQLGKAHLQTLRVWATTGVHVGELPNRSGVCADPHLENRTTSCKVHLLLVARELANARRRAALDKEAPNRRRTKATNEHVVKASIQEHLDRVCCAKFQDGREECHSKFCDHHIQQETTKRMARILRKLSDAGDPRAARVGPDLHAIIENVLIPDLHADPECRTINESTLYFGGPTRLECTGRSLLRHGAKKYGVSADQIQAKMHEHGLSVGRSMQQFQKTFGMFKEISSSGNRGGARAASVRARAKAGREAVALLRRSSTTRGAPGPGRRLADTPRGRARAERRRALRDEEDAMGDEELARHRVATRGVVEEDAARHGFAHAARTIKQHRKVLANASATIDHHFKRLEKRSHSERLRRLNSKRMGGGHQHQDPTPRVDRLRADNLRQHAINPILGMEILQADEGSLTSRFKNGMSSMAGLARRWNDANYASQLENVKNERRRRLSEAANVETSRKRSELFDELERQHAARLATQAGREAGRRLGEAPLGAPPELPAKHGLSWLHEVVDWRQAATEWQRLHSLLEKRNALRLEGRHMTEILSRTKTGYHLLDSDTFAFSRVGDALRRLWHRRVNKTDEHFVNFTRSTHDHAGRHNPAKHGRARRLGESFLGPAVAAPYALFDTVVGTGSATPNVVPETGEDIFTATIRWIVFSTVGCYLVKPQKNAVTSALGSAATPGEGSDGEELKVLRPDDSRVCFPAFPFVLVSMPTFRQLTKSVGVDFDELRYEEFCLKNSYQVKARDLFRDTFGFDPLGETGRWLGLDGVLRGAEAVDSFDNFVRTSSGHTESELDGARIGHLTCGIIELGGVVYILLILLFLTFAVPLVQLANITLMFAFDVGVLLSAASKAPAEAAKTAKEGKEKAKKAKKAQKTQKETQGGAQRETKTLTRTRGGGGGGGGSSTTTQSKTTVSKRPARTGEAAVAGFFGGMFAGTYDVVSPDDDVGSEESNESSSDESSSDESSSEESSSDESSSDESSSNV